MPAPGWPGALRPLRDSYSAVRKHHLRYIKHPELLNELPLDPLADDPVSPWAALREDELVRAEILQDVQRLPDEPLYREESIRAIILDILFLYCKLHPRVGGYRQGMHELLAPIVFAVHQDCIDRTALDPEDLADPAMVDTLDSAFVEHDCFALFSRLMDRASVFYEVGPDKASGIGERSSIVERSQHIHEMLLTKVDPELAAHLKRIDVLPQIFLIRWIRLLFGREFPLEQLLVLWDTIFAYDPSLDLVDLICTAMLLRVRWTLLEADYSVALQTLLKYPAPQAPHGPHTFVDDAIYLKEHLHAAGGATLVMKYTGKSPSVSASSSRPTTPSFQAFGSLRQRTLGARSPLSASARLMQQPGGGVEALFQGAAKGVMERGERLGINQAVRDAIGEIRRNVQSLQDARTRSSMDQDRANFADETGSRAIAAMESRNRHLAALLDESIADLKAMAASRLHGEKEALSDALELAAAKIQLVKVYLEDNTLALPGQELPAINTLKLSSPRKPGPSPTVALDTTPVIMSSTAIEAARASPSPSQQGKSTAMPRDAAEAVDRMDTDDDAAVGPDSPEHARVASGALSPARSPAPSAAPDELPAAPGALRESRPHGPIPTRSTLAQSSFSWMLEPDASPSSSSPLSSGGPPSTTGRPHGGHRKPARGARRSASRERNAFLFGEVGGEGAAERRPSAEEGFGLQPIRKSVASGSGSRGGLAR